MHAYPIVPNACHVCMTSATRTISERHTERRLGVKAFTVMVVVGCVILYLTRPFIINLILIMFEVRNVQVGSESHFSTIWKSYA